MCPQPKCGGTSVNLDELSGLPLCRLASLPEKTGFRCILCAPVSITHKDLTVMADTAPAAPQQPSTTAWILRHQLLLRSQLTGPFHSHWGISTSGEETLAWTTPPSKVSFPMSTGLCSPEKGITLHPGSSRKPSSRPGGLPARGALQSFARGGVPWSHRPIGQMGKLRPGKAKDLL